jgi:hypothetical protein
MSKEEWLAQYKERQAEETQKEAEERKRAAEKAERAREAQKQQQAAQRDESERLAAGTRRSDVLRGEDVRRRTGRVGSGSRVGRATTQELPPLPMLPDAFADWGPRDYAIARMTGDPVLPAAVESLAEKSAGDPEAAEFLIRLLRSRFMADVRDRFAGRGDDDRRRHGRGRDGEPVRLIEAIVAALGGNGTDLARQTLVKLLTGEFETENDKAAALAAVKGLVDNRSAANEAVLFQLITAADDIRPLGQGDVTPDELRREALELLKPTASSHFRVSVAEKIVDPDTSPELRKELRELTAEMHPDNFEAHVVLFQSDLTDAREKAMLEQHFTWYSSEALAHLLGLAPLPEKAGGVTDTDWPYRVAGKLWGPEVEVGLERRMRQADSFEKDAQPVLLAATVPTDSMRAELYRKLRRHWGDGPESLKPAKLAEGMLADPGAAVLVKMLLREQNPEARLAARAARSRLRSTRRVEEIRKLRKEWHEHFTEAEEDWADSVTQMQETFGQRLQALSGGATWTSLRVSMRPAALPLDVPDDAQVIEAYRFDWQRELEGELPTHLLDPMEIRYVRFEKETRPSSLIAFYRRRVEDYIEREIEEGLWLDGLDDGSQPGRKRGIDVRIQRAVTGHPHLQNEEQLLVVDILSVEINDPRRTQQETNEKLNDPSSIPDID